MPEKDMNIHGKARIMIETRDHSMDLGDDITNVQSLDSKGVVLNVSPGWLKLTGYEREDVIGHSFREFLVDESLGKVKNEFPHLKDYGFVDNVALKIRRKDGVIIEAVLNGTSKYDSNGNFERTFCELRSLDYYMNSVEAVSDILTLEKFLRMIINLKSNIDGLFRHIIEENYTMHKLYDDLLAVIKEPSEIEHVMIGRGERFENDELKAVQEYYTHYKKAFPKSNMLLVKAEGYYGKVSSELKDKSVIIMSVGSGTQLENILLFLEFNNSNIPYKEWDDAFDDVRLQIEHLIALAKIIK